MSDAVLGRARVEDNDELRKYYEELRQLQAGALWTVANDIEPWHPRALSDPMLWRFDDLRPYVMRATELVSAEDAGRRVVMLLNPRRRDVSATVGWLYTGIQAVRPGESTSAHKHAASALRFVMEGSGAYTVVDGSVLHVSPGDFLLTPGGTWHDHGNRSDSECVIWQDGLDIALVNALESNNYAVHPDLQQQMSGPVNASQRAFGVGGLVPAKLRWEKPYSPLTYYPWERAYEALTNFAEVTDGCPFDGVMMEYTNPTTGGPVLPTMGACIQMLRPGEHTKAHRHTGNVIYQAAKGAGFSIIDGRRFDWKEKDIFCIPSWAVHEHANASSNEDAVLFSFNDFPVLHSLSLWMEQAYPDNGGRQQVI